MRSHTYTIAWRRVWTEVWPIFACALVFAIAARVWLLAHPDGLAAPEPSPGQIILAHQWTASGSIASADTLLIGDSSCLMDVDALFLEQFARNLRGQQMSALNLGTMSTFSMEAFGDLVDRFLAQNRASVKRIIVLIHPEMLRKIDNSAERIREKEIRHPLTLKNDSVRARTLYWMGLDLLDRRWLKKWIPAPLPNQWGSFYGFQKALGAYMTEHKGSAVESTAFRNTTSKAEFIADPTSLEATRKFRARIPRDIKLFAGLTPMAQSAAPKDFAAQRQRMLEEWTHALEPDVVLDIPATLPDSCFATHTHLSKEIQKPFTKSIARQILNANPVSKNAGQ